MDFDARVKVAVYDYFATTGAAPGITQLAEHVAATVPEVRHAYARLRAKRVLLLEPDGQTIRMAPPFSGVPTQHHVVANSREYVANCAWDALGVVAALQQPGVVHSECAQSRQPLRLDVGRQGPDISDWLFHCL